MPPQASATPCTHSESLPHISLVGQQNIHAKLTWLVACGAAKIVVARGVLIIEWVMRLQYWYRFV
jgi:hypothetical protein